MKLEFKPVHKQIRLGEYAEEMAGAVIEVRVNVTRETLSRMLSVSTETLAADYLQLLAELWSWPVENVQALWQHCTDCDPQLWRWVTSKTFNLVFEYQSGQKKT